MEIPARSWIPATTRNRWAWGFAWASLAVFLLWNLMPDYGYTNVTKEGQGEWIAKGLVMNDIWPEIVEELFHSIRSTPDFEDMLAMMATLALIFTGMLQFVLAPLWRVISSSRLLRFIPAGICLLGSIVVIYFICRRLAYLNVDLYFRLFVLSLIALNLLLSTIALLLYHPEHAEVHEA
jgi:hypothetical protein